MSLARYTASTPCPICGGHNRMPRGIGQRCAGYASTDGEWARCSREEHAHGLNRDERTEPPTYAHHLVGSCKCGVLHRAATSPHVQRSRAGTAADASRRIVARYPYRDVDGRVAYEVARTDPKGFIPRHPDPATGAMVSGLAGVEARVPYRLPELLAAPSETLFWPEGEKDCERLIAAGLLATTTHGGAKSFRKHAAAYAEHCRGRGLVTVLPDNDDDGRPYAAEVAAALHAVGAGVRVVELPGLPSKGDVSDWLDAGHDVAELNGLALAAPEWRPVGPCGTEARHIGDLLDEVRAVLRRYLVLPGEHFYDAVAVWVAHSHAICAADTTARLFFKSAEKESGKTRALEVLELIVPAPLPVFNISTAAIFRLLKDEQATVLLDECDAVFNPRAGSYEDLRALLNAGYRRGATVARMVGDGNKMRVERFPVFAATALAAIGDLPDTIESRALVVPMRRRAPLECVEKFRRRRAEPELGRLREELAAWAASCTDGLATSNPVMPEGLEDRAEDCWEPLIAIAGSRRP